MLEGDGPSVGQPVDGYHVELALCDLLDLGELLWPNAVSHCVDVLVVELLVPEVGVVFRLGLLLFLLCRRLRHQEGDGSSVGCPLDAGYPVLFIVCEGPCFTAVRPHGVEVGLLLPCRDEGDVLTAGAPPAVGLAPIPERELAFRPSLHIR